MAVELCRDYSVRGLSLSPRLSFSHDLNQSDILPVEALQSSLLDYDFDFDFCVTRRSCDGESSLADEIFANGVILPIEIKSKEIPMSIQSAPSSPLLKSSVPRSCETEESKETEEEEEKQGSISSSKLFWKFKRSKSHNLYKRGLLWPLPPLSRSKSTGSTASEDKGSIDSKGEDVHHQNHENINGGMKKKKNSSSPKKNHQKPPLNKSSYGSSSYNYRVVRVSSALNLNVPTEKLLGFASIFSHGKDKTKKK